MSERLDVIPAQFRVLVTRRPKYACRRCSQLVVQAHDRPHHARDLTVQRPWRTPTLETCHAPLLEDERGIMPTPRETILTALHARLSALLATALRGDVLPERVPTAGLLILRDGDLG